MKDRTKLFAGAVIAGLISGSLALADDAATAPATSAPQATTGTKNGCHGKDAPKTKNKCSKTHKKKKAAKSSKSKDSCNGKNGCDGKDAAPKN